MVSVLTQTKIARPRDEVAAFAADPDRAPLWCGRIVSVGWETPRPLGVGSRLVFETRLIGRTLSQIYEVTVHSPPHKLVMRARDGRFPSETTYTWHETIDGHTRMTLRNVGEPEGVIRMAGPLFETAMRRRCRKDLKVLRALLEA
jgi:hypothetical protein